MRIRLAFIFAITALVAFGNIPDYNLIHSKQYTIKDGLPQSFVKHIFQDSKGYIWVSTQDGISRFNGNEFKNFYYDPYSSNSLISNYVLKISQWTNNELLVGSPYGLCFVNPNQSIFKNINFKRKEFGAINAIDHNAKKELFVSSSRGLFKIVLKDSTSFQTERLDSGRTSLLQTRGNDLFYVKENLFFQNQKLVFALPNRITSYLVTDKGFLVGTKNGLYYIKLGVYDNPVKLLDTKKVNTIKQFNNEYWIGTDQGIIVLNKALKYNQTISKNSGNGLLSDNIQAIFKDSFGIIWIGTSEGLNKLDISKQQFLHVKRSSQFNDPNLNDNVWCFYKHDSILYSGHIGGVMGVNENSNASKWLNAPGYVLSLNWNKNKLLIGSSTGLYKLDPSSNATPQKILVPDSIMLLNIFCIKQVEKFILVGSSYGITVFNKNLKFLTHKKLNNVRNIIEDKNGEIWFTAFPTAIYKLNLQVDKKLLSPPSSKNVSIRIQKHPLPQLEKLYSLCLYPDSKSNLWLGLFGGGVISYNTKTKQIAHFSTNNGLANNSVYGILEDKSNHLWMSTNSGLSRFHIRERKFNSYNLNDGLQSMEFNSGAFYKTDEHHMYFGGVNGYNIVNPGKYQHNTIKPIVHISSIKHQQKELIQEIKDSVLSIPHWKNSFTISVDGLHYASPEENIYAYYLQGFSEKWISTKNKREFYFSNLNPGEYTFKIRVANSDREWMEKPEELKIIVEPAYYQTWLFRISIALFILGALFGVYYYRTQQRKIQRRLLERKIRERTKEVEHQKSILEQQKALIEEEKDREEQLLLNVLPLETAKELISTGRAAPKDYKMASVMFADFKNFTKITENLSPKELVEELDDFFAHFDDIVDEFGIEKIKTSGDAYMCAGGIPIRNRTNPVDCVLTAMEFIKFVDKKKAEREGSNKQLWEIRIGIHTGELVAGVVGKKKFLYDIWGDTVNTAARMETSADPGRINISGTTYEFVKDYFECEYRGKIPVKNKGLIDMYYINRILPELSIGGEGHTPNKRFFELLNFNTYSQTNYNKVKQYVLNKLKRELPSNLYYHGVHHTMDVIEAAERIGKAEGVDSEHLMLIKLAALFHDSGFLIKYVDNEPQGAILAKELLPKYGFTDHQVDLVEGMILATKIPQDPQNHLEEIMCDADLDYLGRNKAEFDKISNSLQQEFLEYGIIQEPEQWDPIQIKFLGAHKYYTKTCQVERSAEKAKRLEEIVARVGEA